MVFTNEDRSRINTAYQNAANAQGALNRLLGKTLTSTAVLNFAEIAAQAGEDLTIALVGAAVGDAVFLGPPAAPEAGLTYVGFVSAADVVTVRCLNVTAAPINPASATFRVMVIKP